MLEGKIGSSVLPAWPPDGCSDPPAGWRLTYRPRQARLALFRQKSASPQRSDFARKKGGISFCQNDGSQRLTYHPRQVAFGFAPPR